MRNALRYAGFLGLLLLTGCGNPQPSSTEIQAAIQHYMLGPKSEIIDAKTIYVDEFKAYRQTLTAEKIACQRSEGAPGMMCDFDVKTCLSREDLQCEPEKLRATGRFVKTDKGWTYMPTDPRSALYRPADSIDQIMMGDIMRNGGIAGKIR